MPWGCIGQSELGDSGPGTGDCGLPGTFTLNLGFVPRPINAVFDSKPRIAEAE
jgi:hypothetical protein